MTLTVIRHHKSIGKTIALKSQARELDSDVLVILDADTVLESENYIARLVEELYQGVGVASVCGTVRPLYWRDRRRLENADPVQRAWKESGLPPARAGMSAMQIFETGITNTYRDVLYMFLQRLIYRGEMLSFGSIVNPVGCAVAYRRSYLARLFGEVEPRYGDDITNSEDIFIGFALLDRGYRNVQGRHRRQDRGAADSPAAPAGLPVVVGIPAVVLVLRRSPAIAAALGRAVGTETTGGGPRATPRPGRRSRLARRVEPDPAVDAASGDRRRRRHGRTRCHDRDRVPGDRADPGRQRAGRRFRPGARTAPRHRTVSPGVRHRTHAALWPADRLVPRDVGLREGRLPDDPPRPAAAPQLVRPGAVGARGNHLQPDGALPASRGCRRPTPRPARPDPRATRSVARCGCNPTTAITWWHARSSPRGRATIATRQTRISASSPCILTMSRRGCRWRGSARGPATPTRQ